jgi:hypothetical protein
MQRRAMVVLASAGGNTVPAIARLVQADEQFLVSTANTRPTALGQPFARWSIRKLADYLAGGGERAVPVGRERLRRTVRRSGTALQWVDSRLWNAGRS